LSPTASAKDSSTTRSTHARAVATWHATDTIQACREACGGAGYLKAGRFAALKADTDVFTTFEGDNTVLLQLCAKNLLTDHRDQVGELDPLGMARFFGGQAIGIVAERTAVRGVLARLADGLVPGRDAGRDPFAVLVDCQDHVVATARAWVDVTVLEAFADAVDACEDPALRAVLDRLCSLHALHRIEAERGWFQEHGRLTPQRSKAVVRTVNALCAEVRHDAGLLVEAFGVPVFADAGPVAEADREARLERLRAPAPQPA